MSIDELVKKHAASLWLHEWTIRAALTEQAKTHAMELRAYETTVQNLEQRIRELEAQRVPEGCLFEAGFDRAAAAIGEGE